MKKMMILVLMMTIAITASAMSYSQARNEALFLSDKMAYELDLTDDQYDAVYEINLDYLMSLNGHSDFFGIWWNRRNNDLRYVLTSWQYDRFMGRTYFYRPVSWFNGSWLFNIYTHYVYRDKFYRHHPKVYVSYKGGNNRKHNQYYAERNVHPSNRGKAVVKRHDKNDRPQPSHNARPTQNNERLTKNNDRHSSSARQNAHPAERNNTRVVSSVAPRSSARNTSSRATPATSSSSARTGGGRGGR